jgi:hypothetical protein
MMKVKKRSSKCSQRQSWMTVSKNWCNLEIGTNKCANLNFAFANHGEEDEIYPLTTIEIAEAQCKDQELKAYYKKNAIMPKKDVCLQRVEDTKVLCKNGKLIIPASPQRRAVAWYHHYLQHPGHSRLEETMRSMMYWKGMRTTIQRYVKSCKSCQVNKKNRVKYGHDIFLADAAWAIRSTHHKVLKASPGAAIFGQDMLFDIPFIAD